MAKITIETDDIAEARSVLDALEARSGGGSTPAPTAAPTTPAASEEREDTSDVDVHGMPWNEEIHTGTRATNADGSWKARKGKAAEAKAALDAFKAGGGDVEPPADLPTPAPTGMPGAIPAAAPAPTGMPAPAQRDMPPPVTYEAVEAKVMGMLERGSMTPDSYGEMLDRHGIDRADPTSALQTNESLRAAVMNDCLSVEPEA